MYEHYLMMGDFMINSSTRALPKNVKIFEGVKQTKENYMTCSIFLNFEDRSMLVKKNYENQKAYRTYLVYL